MESDFCCDRSEGAPHPGQAQWCTKAVIASRFDETLPAFVEELLPTKKGH